jgi:hypothetical protein
MFVVRMGFEGVLESDSRRRGFGSQRYRLCGKERPHASKSAVDAHDGADYLKLGEAKQIQYAGWSGIRYLAFENITYDIAITLYDVDSSRAYGLRLFGPKDLAKPLKAGLRSVMGARPNVEARVFGLQDKEDHSFLAEVLEFLSKEEIRLIEVDFFGENVRHIAIDLKTGASFDLLLEDRLYRPGELINRLTIDDFKHELLPKTGIKPKKP